MKSIETMPRHLCTGCGFCAGTCPKKCIAMREEPNGLVRPNVDSGNCVKCSRCLGVCGGRGLRPEVFRVNVDPFGVPPRRACLSQASDKARHRNGQSGGAVTAILASLLDRKEIDAALVTTMPRNGTLRPHATLVRNSGELAPTQGSVYVQVPLGEAVGTAWKSVERIAMVGLPCHFHSLYNMEKCGIRDWNDRIVLKIGLACNRVFSRAVYDFLLRENGIRSEECLFYRSRDKRRRGWPGEGRVVLKNGGELFVKDVWHLHQREKLTPLRCRLCFDKMNFLSDITATDPWGLRKDGDGWTVLLARTEVGEKMTEDIVRRNEISALPIEWKNVYGNLYVEDRRFDWKNGMEIMRDLGMAVPEYSISEHWIRLAKEDAERRKHLEMLFQRSIALETFSSRESAVDFISGKKNICRREKEQ